MLKKLAVPFLTLALATFGCSSSTTNNGTGGSGGGAGTSAAGGKGGGAAGSSAAGTSGGGGKAGGGGSAAAGSGGGAAGSSAAGTSGGAGGKAGAGGGNGGAGGKVDAGTSMADCTVTTSGGTDKLAASVFCANLFAYCSNITGLTLPANETDCETLYNNSGQQHCRSYHMCWGVEGMTQEGGVGEPMIHCFHTVGMKGVCTATTDAASGN